MPYLSESTKKQQRLLKTVADSRRAYQSGQVQRGTPEELLAHVLMGKYAFVPTSSEDFTRRKQQEIELETRQKSRDTSLCPGKIAQPGDGGAIE